MIIEDTHLDLLLRLLEARELVYTHGALLDYHGQKGRALIEAGLMVTSGFDRFVLDDERDGGEPVEVEMNAVRGLGYHSPCRGWVPVVKTQLQRYRPDFAAIIRMLLGHELVPLPRGPQAIDAGLVWEVGRMRLLRTGLVEVLFARRLDDRDIFERLRTSIETRPSSKLRLLLTSTRRLPLQAIPMLKLVPVADVLSSTEPSRIDFEILKARFASTAREAIIEPVHLSEDGRRLTVNGTLIILRGDVQIAIIKRLVDAYKRGVGLKAADLLLRSGSKSDSLDQAFGKAWREIRNTLKTEKGLWSFDI